MDGAVESLRLEVVLDEAVDLVGLDVRARERRVLAVRVDDDEGDASLEEFLDEDADGVGLAGAGLREDRDVFLDEAVDVEDDGALGAFEEPEVRALLGVAGEAEDTLDEVRGGAADLGAGLERGPRHLEESAFVPVPDDLDLAGDVVARRGDLPLPHLHGLLERELRKAVDVDDLAERETAGVFGRYVVETLDRGVAAHRETEFGRLHVSVDDADDVAGPSSHPRSLVSRDN